MALPTLTRAIGFRDDMTVTSTWTLSGTGTFTTDGDIGTLTSTSAGTVTLTQSTSALSTNTYTLLMVRANPNNASANVKITYGDSTTQQLNLPGQGPPFAYVVSQLALNTGKTISQIQINQTGNTNFVLFDFVLVFKELLTLPTAIQPLQEKKQRNIIEIPILQKEGGQVQDLGSMSPEITIGGGLVNTGQYTADQWWQILKGLILETGITQSDGNPTWQWLTSDDINGKMLLRGASLQQVPGRIAYHNYALALKQFDVVGETTANLVGINY